MRAHTFRAMIDKLSTVMDAFKIAEGDDSVTASGDDLDKLPPLRRRILRSTTAGLISYAPLTFADVHRPPSTLLHQNRPLS